MAEAGLVDALIGDWGGRRDAAALSLEEDWALLSACRQGRGDEGLSEDWGEKVEKGEKSDGHDTETGRRRCRRSHAA